MGASYTRGLDLSGTLEGAGGIGGLLARSRHATTSPYAVNGNSFYHADGNGKVTYLAGSSGGADAAYRYDPFGRLLAWSGSYATANVMRFSSKPWVAHNGSTTDGLYYYGYRFYDPQTQRWPNRDPIGEMGGINLYGYVFNDPVNEIDPYGLAVGDWYDPRTYWNEVFLEGWSKGGQGVINAFTGGLFWPEYGLFYDTFDKQWKDLGTDGTKDDSAFKFGNNGGRVAVACLAGAGALSRTAIGNANMGWKGGEITFTRPGAPTPDWRINPFGGSGYPPHYHRRGPGGIGRHRPWQPGKGSPF